MKAKKLTLLAMLFALALILSVVESSVPPLMGMIPGIKLGLSNIVVMYTLFFMGVKEALLIAVLKAFFVLLVRGLISSALSISGGVSSVLVMWLLLQFKRADFSYIMLSIAGSVTHNIVQLTLAIALTGSKFVAAYLPVLLIAGIVMGIVTGTILRALLPFVERFST